MAQNIMKPESHEVVNRIKVNLKTRRHVIPISRFIVECIIDDAPICDIGSRVAEAMVSKLAVHDALKVM